MTQTLAEALSEVAALRTKTRSLIERATSNARYQEGEEPAERAGDLLNEALAALDRIERLTTKINLANAEHGLTPMLSRRDVLEAEFKAITSVANAATGQTRLFRRTGSELRDVTDVQVTALRTHASAVAEELRRLNLELNRRNFEITIDD